jgi:hypothetical protein
MQRPDRRNNHLQEPTLIPVFVRCKVQIAPFVLAPTLVYSLLQEM